MTDRNLLIDKDPYLNDKDQLFATIMKQTHNNPVTIDILRAYLVFLKFKVSKNRLKRWNGKRVEVIIEDIDSEKEVLIGRGPADSPEIDGLVHVYPDRERVSTVEIGNFALVEIIGNNEYDLIAKIVSN